MSYRFADNQTTMNQTSSFGMAPNIAALISYLCIPVTSIVVLATEKENRLVRFHAFQSLFLGLAVFAVSIVLSPVMTFLGTILAIVSPSLGVIVAFLLLAVWLIFPVTIFAVWIVCLFKAYRGETYRLPVIGKYASDFSGR
jgi:uncharacterized membrane protein